jgi:hypothetical protein
VNRMHRRVAPVAAALIAVTALPFAGPGLFLGAGAAPARTTEVRAGPHVVVGRWTVRVGLSRRRIGPLRLRTGRVQRAPDTSSQPWGQHELRIRNVGRRKVRLGDTRTSRYLRGPVGRALLGADEGCGYGIASGSDEIDVGVCADYLDAPTLRPGKRIRRTVTLFKGLMGMTPLRAGTYVFPKRISYKVADRRVRVRVRVVYKIEAR